MRDKGWLLSSDKAEEAAQRGQTAIACTDCVVAFLFGMLQECAHFRSGEFARRGCSPSAPGAVQRI